MATIFGAPDDTATVMTVKTANKTSYSPGETVTYTITVANMGPVTAVSPVVSDQVPSIVQNPQFSVDSGTTWETGLLRSRGNAINVRNTADNQI